MNNIIVYAQDQIKRLESMELQLLNCAKLSKNQDEEILRQIFDKLSEFKLRDMQKFDIEDLLADNDFEKFKQELK